MLTWWNYVPRFQPTAIHSVRLVLCTVLAIGLAGGCAHQRERSATPGASPAASSPWALPTSTMRWNEYACELIARNQIGQFPAARALAYMNLGVNNAIVAARQQGRKPRRRRGRRRCGRPDIPLPERRAGDRRPPVR
jgi:hypothetical protein